MSERLEFLSCDWGTSSLRVRWIKSGQVFQEFRNGSGCKSINDHAAASHRDRPHVYAECLKEVLLRWNLPASGLPLVISGMASSTIGWKELPYAQTPLRIDGSGLLFEKLAWEKPAGVGTTYLISGLATGDEIMRGEETEAIGLLADDRGKEGCLLILPGTHSKHLKVENGAIMDFSTYMTGELFDVLARHSILKATVDVNSLPDPAPKNLDAFTQGVREAERSGMGAALFKTRTRAILRDCASAENSWFLSGVLIGGELNGQGTDRATKILVGGAQPLRGLYSRALELLYGEGHRENLTDEQINNAVPKAHGLFLEAQDQ